MNLLKKLPITIATCAALIGCDNLELQPSVPLPEQPEPIDVPPAETFQRDIGNASLTALKESLVIRDLTGKERLAAVESFKGIQYAEVKRFVHSEKHDLSGEINATQFGDACPQVQPTAESQSEQCLNLNIWRPTSTEANDDLPVYVFIHGGDFEYGSGASPLIQGDTVVAQGAEEGNPFIYVSFNYRLGELGSRWVKGENIDGNYGLGDQQEALKWLKDNIQDFGGNPDKITLMGQGSGAMSIALLQQRVAQGSLNDDLFHRAIMQSPPTGFDNKSYQQAKRDHDNTLEHWDTAPIEEILQVQEEKLDSINRLVSWLTLNINLGLLYSDEASPMSALMPYAPYLQCSNIDLLGKCEEGFPQPSLSHFVVPTMIGVNANEADTISLLPNLTSLIAIIMDELGDRETSEELMANDILAWVESEDNREQLKQHLNSTTSLDAGANIELPKSAYEAVTSLFYGLNNTTSKELLALGDFYPNDEHELDGALNNMRQYRTLMNDTLFTGPARQQAANSDNSSFYYFEHKPSFNVWTPSPVPSEDGEISDLLKTVSCISGACNSSELPFVFNKNVKRDGTEVRPSKKDQQLMGELSRLWFSEALFDAYRYDITQDEILLIDRNGIQSSGPDWDKFSNEGLDPALRNGRLSGLEDLGILLGYMPKS
ncbi:para-nitrobenzyl esterase [Vibrio fortis]|uniref:Para-nitrobenzyl esterase n=1 Tax=Vibrio fortis TaxID=212667 RepID=A0A066UK64_9VIBR|nr:carboxylesterase family protein [Vibrio fortis]KDN27460.1 para-nitrobenzyl esterase [Vibrio fortis]